MSSIPRPPYDPELGPALMAMRFSPTVTKEKIPILREMSAPTSEQALGGRNVIHEERQIAGPRGDITISIIRSQEDHSVGNTHPGIFFIHGGGMIVGNRFLSIGTALDWVEEHNAVCITVEYCLSPEHPDPAPLEDCFAALEWVQKHMQELGINPNLLMIAGASAGGGIAAGTALMNRDQGGPPLCAQILICPMLDDRSSTVSGHQYVQEGSWSRGSNITGWTCLLGNRCGTNDVSIYAAPSRATDLSNLPPTFIDVGDAEVFRDEAVNYATTLWKCGVSTDLHVWGGGFHGFDLLVPNAEISVTARETRSNWVRRVLKNANQPPRHI